MLPGHDQFLHQTIVYVHDPHEGLLLGPSVADQKLDGGERVVHNVVLVETQSVILETEDQRQVHKWTGSQGVGSDRQTARGAE